MRTQYVEGIYRPNYLCLEIDVKDPLTVSVNGTIGYILHDFVVVVLLDVEYYHDLEIWVS